MNKISKNNRGRGEFSPLLFLCHFCALFIIGVAAISCGNNLPKNTIALHNQLGLHLTAEEQLTVLDSSSLHSYEKQWENKPIQVPLYKVIKGKNHNLFVGIPFTSNLKQAILMNSVLEKSESFISRTDSSTYLYTFEKNDSVYFAEYYLSIEGNFLYLLTQGSFTQNNDSLFTQEFLSKRIFKLN